MADLSKHSDSEQPGATKPLPDTCLYIPENVTNMIASEYRASVMGEIRKLLKQLDAGIYSGDVVMARRVALIDVLNILDERNWYRAYKLAGMPPLEERMYEE